MSTSKRLNVFGKPIKTCNTVKITGYDRSGFCYNYENDPGTHIVCAIVTEYFLNFTKSRGNDLITPRGSFPGLKPGDRWCICIKRWLEAYKAGFAPPIIGESTDISVLEYVPSIILQNYVK